MSFPWRIPPLATKHLVTWSHIGKKIPINAFLLKNMWPQLPIHRANSKIIMKSRILAWGIKSSYSKSVFWWEKKTIKLERQWDTIGSSSRSILIIQLTFLRLQRSTSGSNRASNFIIPLLTYNKTITGLTLNQMLKYKLE